jgi:hypothetical protein
MLYDDGRDAYVCNCGFAEANGPADAELEKVAAIVAAKVVAEPDPVFACNANLVLSVNFEGAATQSALVKKLKLELMSAIRSAVSITAREMRVKAIGVTVEPMDVTVEAKKSSSER